MTLILIVSLLVLLAIGLFLIIRRLQLYKSKLDFTFTFRNKFVEFANSYIDRRSNIDNQNYSWLIKNMDKAQRNAGSLGLVQYSPPFQSYYVKNYPVIVNTIPKFRQQSIEETDIHLVDDSLMRCIGEIESSRDLVLKKLKNPLIWFREGFHEIMSLPISVLNWFGIISNWTAKKITSNIFYKMFSGIAGLAAFIGSLITIFQGKQAIFDIINYFAK